MRRVKNTRAGGSASTVTLADDHFQKLARARLDADFKAMGIAPRYTVKVSIPPEERWDGIIREALFRRRRGRKVEVETWGVIHCEVRRLFEEHKDSTRALSQRQASEKFWAHLTPGERYAKYRVVVKDHKQTIKACLEGLT